MGVGKTTLGEYIASTYQLSYVDLDHYIVEQEQMSIPAIFKKHGEQHFRCLEAHYLQECILQFDVIATGGGIIEGAQSIKILQKQSSIVWLDCDLKIVYDRIRNDPNRPNANNKSLYDLKNLYSDRYSRYNEIAFIKVNSNQSLKDLHDEIFNELSCD
ncbi:shikimate kinase [Staphylococcus argensis]|nr:shikimate kinase [Staphylococcus argensis]